MSEKVVIGNAELYCGDCMEVLPGLGKVDAVVTDPPYGMQFRSNYRIEKHTPISGDSDDRLFLLACSIEVTHARYVFGRWEQAKTAPNPKSMITWVKNNWSMGDLCHEHARQTEVIFFWPGDRHVFKYRPTDVIDGRRTSNQEHPTEKPVYVMQKVCEWTDGVVVDPFMGSGTTGVACMNLGRKFIGIELERTYFDIACERIEAAQRQGDLFLPDRQGDVYDQVTLDYDG